ncbi:translation machinery-associated protein 20, partial [Phakopsora pachyrhizi]
RFVLKEDVASNTALKSSAQRSIRSKLLEQMPVLSQPINNLNQTSDGPTDPTGGDENQLSLIESIWPKKETLYLLKCREHISILVCKGLPLFFQRFDEAYFPTLRLVHQYPTLLPQVQVDRGAIKFVLSGANIMCPGLTSPGASLPDQLATNTPVSVLAEGKQHACAIGFTQMSSIDMRKINKGIGVDNIHYLGDDLWAIESI